MNKNPDNPTEYFRWEFGVTGELYLMRQLSGKLKTIFDVGSNVGEWTRLAREFNPEAQIHSFEVLGSVFKKQMGNLQPDDKMILNSFGLAHQTGIVEMAYNPEYDAISTMFQEFDVGSDNKESGFIVKGDDYVRARKVDYIDFLKIDVEGAEQLVLQGLSETIKNKVGIIFFEYGFVNVLSKFLLVDAYRILQPLGYKIGKYTEEGWNPKDFQLTDEDFGHRTGKHVLAVHESKLHLFS